MISARAKLRAQANRISRTISSMFSMRQSFSKFNVSVLPADNCAFFLSINGINWFSRCCRMVYVSFDENCGSLDSSIGMVSANRDGQKLQTKMKRFTYIHFPSLRVPLLFWSDFWVQQIHQQFGSLWKLTTFVVFVKIEIFHKKHEPWRNEHFRADIGQQVVAHHLTGACIMLRWRKNVIIFIFSEEMPTLTSRNLSATDVTKMLSCDRMAHSKALPSRWFCSDRMACTRQISRSEWATKWMKIKNQIYYWPH